MLSLRRTTQEKKKRGEKKGENAWNKVVVPTLLVNVWEQGWRSGFDSRTRRHMWVEFVVSSRPCSEDSPGTPVFLPPQKLTFPNYRRTS